MATTDGKLFRVFTVAGERSFSSRPDLAREVEARQFDEFSYEENGERKYLGWRAIQDYVGFAAMLGLLDGELQPFARTQTVTRAGFEQTLGERVQNFADASGFSETKLRNATRELLGQTPSKLPTPRSMFKVIQPSCVYNIFYKAITVVAFQERSKVYVRSRQTFMIDGILEE